MTYDASTFLPRASLRELFEPSRVEGILREVLCTPGSSDAPPVDVRVERCWPAGNGEFVFEWTFEQTAGTRRSIYGRYAPEPDPGKTTYPPQPPHSTSRIEFGGISAYLPEHNLHLHTPDCDPGLPQLHRCLDQAEMLQRLSPVLDGADEQSEWPDGDLGCRILSYRVGRRATLDYRLHTNDQRSTRLVGKTYHNHKAERILWTHQKLNDQLCWYSNGKIRVPTPIDFLPDLRMTLFGWIKSKPQRHSPTTWADAVFAGVDVLAALHRVFIEDLPSFTVEDERAIINRWYDALRDVDTNISFEAESLRDSLLRRSENIDTARRCTIHRDFYDKQFICAKRTTTILDLDTLSVGDPSVDLGNYLAHLVLDALIAPERAGDIACLIPEAVARYEQKYDLLNRNTLTYYWASAMFRVGAVHALRTTTRQHTTNLWKYAHRILVGKSHGRTKVILPMMVHQAVTECATERTKGDS